MVQEDEVHLHEDEDDLQARTEDVENLPTGDEIVAVESEGKESSHLNTNIDNSADTEH